jgi:uncharacterized protein (DUF1778 family)
MPKKRRKPAGGSKSAKDDVVRFRVSADHKAAMVAAAERDGLDLSQWLRRLALREAGVLGASREVTA